MTRHKRRWDRSLEEWVWDWMSRKDGPVRRAEIIRSLSLSKCSASHCLSRLVRKGCITRTGLGQATRYQVTRTRPEDLRGTAEGSLRALERCQIRYRSTTIKVPRTEPGTLLEQVWRHP